MEYRKDNQLKPQYPKNVYKDYWLTDDGILFKRNMTREQVLWQVPYNGTPCIDVHNVWTPYQDEIKKLAFELVYETGDREIFSLQKAEFEERKKLINLGFGDQYAVPKIYWTIKLIKYGAT